jgi:hypothetical protein
MRKTKYLILMIVALTGFSISCAKSNPVNLVEYAQACVDANQGKVVTVQGFLGAANSTPCLKILKPNRECAFKLLDKVNVVGKEIIAYVAEGKLSNQVETPESGATNVKPSSIFTRENLKIHLADGTEVVPQETVATPVTVTGEIHLTDKGAGDEKLCSISASSIEKR